MIHDIQFSYRGKAETAKVILRLEEDGFYMFAFLKSRELIDEFGRDIEMTTDGIHILPVVDADEALEALKTAILDVVKHLDDFKQYRLRKLLLRKEQMN